MIKNTDSIWSRSAAARAGTIGPLDDDEDDGTPGNLKQPGGAETQKKLGIETEPKKNLMDKEPLSVMDIVMQMWSSAKPTEKHEYPPGSKTDDYDEDDFYTK